MRLGITVVYLVSERNEKLLDLHLGQIEKHTKAPYMIYASVNRLLPEFRRKLEQHPRVKICECPTTDLRSSQEHAFYLDHLIGIALEDGVSHISVLHVDSFPIRSGWAQELADRLSESCVLAAIMRDEVFDQKPLTACLFFHRDFYLKYRPTFLLSDKELSSPAYKQYRRKFNHLPDSGVGYGFKLYTEGLSWYPLRKSSKGHSVFGGIYGDLIFHLGGAAWFDLYRYRTFYKDETSANALRKSAPLAVRCYFTLRQRILAVTPKQVRCFLALLRNVDKIICRGTINEMRREIYERERMQLLDDPEAYLSYLRTGKQSATHGE